LKKPFFVLAPMADVTNYPFRQILTKYAKPDVVWNEFVSADGLMHPEGRKRLMVDLKFADNERPIVAQFFTSTPMHMKAAAGLAVELGFDGVDINMGCPDKSVEKQGAGAACMKNPENAKQIILAAMEGAGSLPVSVKTRIGFNKDEIDTWIKEVLETKPAALSVHLRTRKEMSKVPAHWDHMPRIVELKNKISPETLIIGNGDILLLSDGRQKVVETGCDGIMIGRGVFKNFFVFAEKEPTLRDRYEVAIEHTRLWHEFLGDHKSFEPMRKFYKMYINGFDGASDIRQELFKTKTPAEAITLLEKLLKVIY